MSAIKDRLANDKQVDKNQNRSQGDRLWICLVWIAAIVATILLWLDAPDIRVTEVVGSGCGEWNAAEIREYQTQLLFRLAIPLVGIQIICAIWLFMSGGLGWKFGASLLLSTLWFFLTLWNPINELFMLAQILTWLYIAPGAAILFFVYWAFINRSHSKKKRQQYAAIVLPIVPVYVFIILVVATRTPNIWSC